MIGYEALDLERRKPSVGGACRPYSSCGDILGVARAAGRIGRGVLGCHRHARGHAITAEFDCTPGDPADCRERVGRNARDNRISLLRRKFGRVRTHNLCARTHIDCVSVGKGRVQLRWHDARDHRANSAPEAPWIAAAHRFTEVSLGILVALAVVTVWREEQRLFSDAKAE